MLAVSPNHLTGSTLSADEWMMLAARCAERQAALIVDEVFADYPLAPVPDPAAHTEALTFRLGGLSKSAGLPQVKLGWIVVDGPDALVSDALDRLEIICDTYLSVSTPVQVAAPSLIEHGRAVRDEILSRARANWTALHTLAAAHPAVCVLHAHAGWAAVLRVPSTRSEEDLVVHLVDEDGVLVHPGYFFDFPHESFVVLSLLPTPGDFAEGTRRVLDRVHG